MDYEPSAARKRAILQGKIRQLHEQMYSLELDVRVNARLNEAETVAAIKKDMAKVEQALDLYRADLDALGPDDGESDPENNGKLRAGQLELIK